jgi:hypothetical protein
VKIIFITAVHRNGIADIDLSIFEEMKFAVHPTAPR